MHTTSWEVRPMIIIKGDAEAIISYIWKTSSSVKDLDNTFSLKPIHTCILDPGGLLCYKIPFHKIILHSELFKIQLSRIDEVLGLMNYGEERVPGYIRFPMWNTFIILPILTFDDLRLKLIRLQMSDVALSQNLDEALIKKDLIEKGLVLFKGNDNHHSQNNEKS